MTRRSRKVSADDAFSREVREGMAKAIEDSHRVAPEFFPHGPMGGIERVLEDLTWLVSRGDGWMRWTADKDGKVVYLKYKFTSLAWPNHYVLVSGPIYDIAKLMAALVRKCELVDAGQLRPTDDRPFPHP